MRDLGLDMLILYVNMINVMFQNVRKDTQRFADFKEITRGVSLL